LPGTAPEEASPNPTHLTPGPSSGTEICPPKETLPDPGSLSRPGNHPLTNRLHPKVPATGLAALTG